MARNDSKHLDDHYTKIPNKLINDSTLTPIAKAIYIWMAEKEDNWDYFMAGMVKGLNLNESTIRKHLKLLVEKGWVIKEEQERLILENGKSVYGSVHYDIKVEIDE